MGIRELLGGLDSRTNGNRMFYEKLYLHLQILVTKHKYIYIYIFEDKIILHDSM